MGLCEICGNTYKNTIEIKLSKDGSTHIFDSFECAIQALAPLCNHCGVRMLGHGVEVAEELFCSAHCARQKGYTHLVDHVDLELVHPH